MMLAAEVRASLLYRAFRLRKVRASRAARKALVRLSAARLRARRQGA